MWEFKCRDCPPPLSFLLSSRFVIQGSPAAADRDGLGEAGEGQPGQVLLQEDVSMIAQLELAFGPSLDVWILQDLSLLFD